MNDEVVADNLQAAEQDEQGIIEDLARRGSKVLELNHNPNLSPEQRERYRKALQLARSRERKAEPTDEEIVLSLIGSIPECPRVRAALADVPAEAKAQWRADFVNAFLRSREGASYRDVREHTKFAHHVANRPFRVEGPDTIDEARAIPEWKLLRRQEIERNELPEYAQAEVEPASRYLELFTIDGGRYFFPIPETA